MFFLSQGCGGSQAIGAGPGQLEINGNDMARRKGDVNADYIATRDELVARVMAFVATPEGAGAGLRVLAAKAGVSMATLRHYFGDRDGVFTAVMTRFGEEGAVYLARSAVPEGGFPESVHTLVDFILLGFSFEQVLGIHVAALQEGPASPAIAVAYLEHALDPIIAAVELRLKAHIGLGEMRRADVRVAAMGLVSPLYLACLHQGPLCGTRTRPLDMPTFARAHADAFVAAYSTRSPVRELTDPAS
jgi:AcrR family transcriptional regulator